MKQERVNKRFTLLAELIAGVVHPQGCPSMTYVSGTRQPASCNLCVLPPSEKLSGKLAVPCGWLAPCIPSFLSNPTHFASRSGIAGALASTPGLEMNTINTTTTTKITATATTTRAVPCSTL